jgi:hypothetical protein
MLIAYSFPEDKFKEILDTVASGLKRQGIEYKYQWPHVSVIDVPKDLSEEEIQDVKENLKDKPTFIGKQMLIFKGATTNSCYLVISFEENDKLSKAKEYIRNKYELPKRDSTPHCSILSVDKTKEEDLKKVVSELDLSDMFEGVSFPSKYLQFWKKNESSNIKDVEDMSFQVVRFTESKKKKKKKREKTALAAFYGKGDGRSGATMPPFRAPTNGPTPRLGASLPSPVTGMNAPQFGTVPAAPMVAWKDEIATLFESNFHVCLVCNGNRVMKNNVACPLCSKMDNSVQVSPLGTCVDGGSVDNTNNFMGFDVPWDLR